MAEEVKDNKMEEIRIEEKEENREKEEKVESKPAIAKASKKEKVEEKVEMEREYVVPLRRGFLNVPRYKRAKKAVRVLKEFMVRHMKIRDRDLNKIKVDINLNNEIWFRGIKKPLHKVKVKAKKIGEIVYVELADAPEVVKFKVAREEKRKAAAMALAEKKPRVKKEKAEETDKDGDGVEDKKEEKEDAKSEAIKDAKIARSEVKAERHTVKGEHKPKTMPVRKSLKK